MTHVSYDPLPTHQADTALPDFALLAEGRYLSAHRGARVTMGGLTTLTERVAATLAATPAATVIAGAVPFDREAEDCLFRARDWSSAARRPAFLEGTSKEGLLAGSAHTITEIPAASAYANAVARSVELLAQTETALLRKVVLARSLELTTDRPIDPHQLLARLALDRSVTAFLVPLPSADTPRWLVGATPELLVAKRGATVESFPLAGSAARQPDADADRRIAEALLRSDKDRREHHAVVEAILDTLTPFCRQLAVPTDPLLRSTASMWHLGTRIVGALKDERTPSTDLLASLHPTPAVCGYPRDAAREAIRRLEPLDRGFYAGAVGWTGQNGDGEWYVTIRCAEIHATRLRLYAGAGIVRGSDACSETRETGAKFNALLDALGVEPPVLQEGEP